MREVNGRGNNNGGGNLLGQIQSLLRWQWQQQPVRGEYTLPVSVLTVVDEGGRQQRAVAVGDGRRRTTVWTAVDGNSGEPPPPLLLAVARQSLADNG